ncbi:Por secretion system C-terminal sorting domain-containing protein [Hymenobacter daecheongensis DSM 21074]|uniref:Por secretion system C-terminal sorting domain-containing protein n=1 Tax=Hymenobacter daecheongensis DSM 21074 TaxID=1121955 RepID=A0A1M6G3S6_9BACT|nr:T9SS type A sorting domain-containing protein [Hymenobacter daecheongensis]SHJ04619.1 Por secretion system C-terminal sorting domain-containing protein [Hymenobacter daecheongensis DSM 21074]
MKAFFSLLILTFIATSSLAQSAWQGAQQTAFTFNGLATDATGNVYATGSFSGTVGMGGTSLTSRGSTDLCIAKFRPDGTLLWAKQVAGAGATAYGAALALDAAGNCYVTGSFTGTLDYNTGGSPLVNSSFWPQILVLKCGPDGAVRWSRQGGGSGYANEARAIAADAAGNCVVTGNLSGTTVTFGHLTFPFSLRRQLFVVRYNAVGTPQWVKTTESSLFTAGNGIGLDATGDCYVTGMANGPMTIDGVTYSGPSTSPISTSPSDIIVAKFGRGQGETRWVRIAGGVGNDSGSSLSVDASGNCFVSGYNTGAATLGAVALPGSAEQQAFVARYTSGGAVVWAQQLHAAEARSQIRLSPDARQLVVMTTPLMTTQARVAAMKVNGTDLWRAAAGGSGQSWGQSLAYGPGQRVYLTGSLMNTCEFGAYSLTGTPGGSFLAHLGPDARRAAPLASTAPAASLELYPNPAHERVTLSLPDDLTGQPVQATLYNRYGRIVLERRLAASAPRQAINFELLGLPAGLYTLQLTSPEHTISHRVAIE